MMHTQKTILVLAVLVVAAHHVAHKAHLEHAAARTLLATYRPDPGVPVEPRRSRNPLIAAHQRNVQHAADVQNAPTPEVWAYTEGSPAGSYQGGAWVPENPSRRFGGRSL